METTLERILSVEVTILNANFQQWTLLLNCLVGLLPMGALLVTPFHP
jgi:hypothetical protein